MADTLPSIAGDRGQVVQAVPVVMFNPDGLTPAFKPVGDGQYMLMVSEGRADEMIANQQAIIAQGNEAVTALEAILAALLAGIGVNILSGGI